MRFLLPATLGLTLVLASSAAAQTVVPPPAPTLLRPADGAEIHKPKTITFRVKGQPNEAEGTLGVELANDGPVGREPDGSYEDEGPYTMGRWELEPVEPGSDVYEVTVSSKLFSSPYDPAGPGTAETYVYWHAYRILPAESCRTIEGDEGPEQDCFQQSAEERTAHVTGVMDPPPDRGRYGKHEPNDSRRSAFSWPTAEHPDALTRGIWLGHPEDKDWYAFTTYESARHLLLKVRNRGNGPMAVILYTGKRVIFRRVLKGGERLRRRFKLKCPGCSGSAGYDHHVLIRHAKGSQAQRVKYTLDGN